MKAGKKIYFLRPIGQDGPIKIGCSINPVNRLQVFLIWSPLRLELVGVADGGHEYERDLHARFARQRLHGEWFAPSPDLTNLINQINNGHSLPIPNRAHRLNRESSADEIEKICAAYASGASLPQIGASIGWSNAKVRRILLMENMVIRTQGRPIGPDLEFIQRARAIEKMRRRGCSYGEIGKEFSISRQRVEQILKKIARRDHLEKAQAA